MFDFYWFMILLELDVQDLVGSTVRRSKFCYAPCRSLFQLTVQEIVSKQIDYTVEQFVKI